MGTGLLALSLGLASYRIRAVEPEKPMPIVPKEKETAKEAPKKPPAARTKREALRYGGKNFDQWRTEMVTELKPEIRVDGLKAFAAFGANGYGPEATQAILEMMRGYDVTNTNMGDDDRKVEQAAYRAVSKIGVAAVPALTAAVKDKNQNARRFAINALTWVAKDACSAVPALLQAMKNEDRETRRQAIETVHIIDPHAKGFVPALIEALKDEDAGIRSIAAAKLREVNIVKDAKPAIPALLEALRDEVDDVRYRAIQTVNSIGASKEAVVTVSRLLQDRNHYVRGEANRFLQSLGSDAKEAVPALIAVLKDPNPLDRIPAVVTLAKIGPAAKDAVPALTEQLRSDYSRLVNEANEALKKISP